MSIVSRSPAQCKATNRNGVVLYEGHSRFSSDDPVVVIVTGLTRPSENLKTGNMLQAWILPKLINPLEAINSGRDAAVCGNCPLRGRIDKGMTNRSRACYVAVRQAPLTVWQAYRAGAYAQFDPTEHGHLLEGRKLRLGSYGEPVAVSLRVWAPLLRFVSGSTGYTHQWRNGRFRPWQRHLMASVDSLDQAREAKAKGWRTFRIGSEGEEPIRGEIRCPASVESGHRTTCNRCGLCCGGETGPNVLISVHGSPTTLASYRRLLESRRAGG